MSEMEINFEKSQEAIISAVTPRLLYSYRIIVSYNLPGRLLKFVSRKVTSRVNICRAANKTIVSKHVISREKTAPICRQCVHNAFFYVRQSAHKLYPI